MTIIAHSAIATAVYHTQKSAPRETHYEYIFDNMNFDVSSPEEWNIFWSIERMKCVRQNYVLFQAMYKMQKVQICSLPGKDGPVGSFKATILWKPLKPKYYSKFLSDTGEWWHAENPVVRQCNWWSQLSSPTFVLKNHNQEYLFRISMKHSTLCRALSLRPFLFFFLFFFVYIPSIFFKYSVCK